MTMSVIQVLRWWNIKVTQKALLVANTIVFRWSQEVCLVEPLVVFQELCLVEPLVVYQVDRPEEDLVDSQVDLMDHLEEGDLVDHLEQGDLVDHLE